MYDPSGVFRPAVEAYLLAEPMTEAQIATMRDYLRQWIAAPWFTGPGIADLRQRVEWIDSRVAIHSWLDDALTRGIDPL